jgi:hypothetical protein
MAAPSMAVHPRPAVLPPQPSCSRCHMPTLFLAFLFDLSAVHVVHFNYQDVLQRVHLTACGHVVAGAHAAGDTSVCARVHSGAAALLAAGSHATAAATAGVQCVTADATLCALLHKAGLIDGLPSSSALSGDVGSCQK